MSLNTEIWLNDLQKNLFPDNAFYKNSKDDSAFISNKIVHIPNSGSKPVVDKNISVLPAPISKRTDVDITYNIDQFTTRPILIEDIEEIETSYAKRSNVLEEHILKLNEEIADNFANKWISGTDLSLNVRTSGSTTHVAAAPSATGTRKDLTVNDLIDAMTKLDNQDIPTEGRILVLPATLARSLQKDDNYTNADKVNSGRLLKGMIGEILGVPIYVRSKIGVFDSAGTTSKGIGLDAAAGATSDNQGGILYHPMMVRRAEGTIKQFANEDDPQFYGSIFSALVRAGGRVSRNDQKGIIAIVEEA